MEHIGKTLKRIGKEDVTKGNSLMGKCGREGERYSECVCVLADPCAQPHIALTPWVLLMPAGGLTSLSKILPVPCWRSTLRLFI